MIENKLLKAVLRRKLSEIKDYVFTGEDPHWRDQNGRTYLHLSVFLKSYELLEYFIDEGLDVDAKDSDNLTALHWACRYGCQRIIKKLMDSGADCGAKGKNSLRPLHIGAAFGHTEGTAVLINESNWEPRLWLDDVLDDDGHTPLHYAAAEGHIATLEMMMNFGDATPHVKNVAGNTPIHFGAATRNPEVCFALIRHKADINSQNNIGQTALHIATLQGDIHTVQQLLCVAADPNIQDTNGNTCSHLALKNGHTDIVRHLMENFSTDSSILDNDENTVIHVALNLGHINLISQMLPRAKDLTKQNSSGCSVIIEAIRCQCEDLALEMLCACPQLAESKTPELVTPLHLAAERGMKNLTRELLVAGAQVDAIDSNGLTPSLYCAKNDAVLECLAMIEGIMVTDGINENNQLKGRSSDASAKISL